MLKLITILLNINNDDDDDEGDSIGLSKVLHWFA
jgi:hypothetical protein